MERRTLVDRIRDWLAGRTPRRETRKEPSSEEHSVFNYPAPASSAGDAPLITSHGQGPSHAH